MSSIVSFRNLSLQNPVPTRGSSTAHLASTLPPAPIHGIRATFPLPIFPTRHPHINSQQQDLGNREKAPSKRPNPRCEPSCLAPPYRAELHGRPCVCTAPQGSNPSPICAALYQDCGLHCTLHHIKIHLFLFPLANSACPKTPFACASTKVSFQLQAGGESRVHPILHTNASAACGERKRGIYSPTRR